MSVTINGTTGITTPDIDSNEYNGGQLAGFRNKIINGGMVIDQRNSGAALTINSNAAYYPVDRFWATGQSADGVFTVEQVEDYPPGFSESLKATVTTADASLTAGQRYYITQSIEGSNIVDLAFGGASAKTVTLSFWVKSTGLSYPATCSGSLRNSGGSRSYPFSYTINASNTWEYKTVTISGDTTGTWLTTTGVGVLITWTLGSESARLGTSNTWAAANYDGATGSTNIMATNGATLYITGVQLEAGSVATPFESRPIGTELALCQRYYYRTSGYSFGNGYCMSTTQARIRTPFPVALRTSPTALEQSGTAGDFGVAFAATGASCTSVPAYFGGGTTHALTTFTTGASLTTGHGCESYPFANAPYLGWSAEL